ncbi:MAG TPA: hypothetical protein VMW12_01260 [Candidatus Dormibacteraeota bacterium]|nr:hypothetical protein [Candidatus Dormibacteraeota bacterium]
MDGQKCGHVQCTCYVDLGQTYCSDRCAEYDKQDADLPAHDRCGCRHDTCMNGY